MGYRSDVAYIVCFKNKDLFYTFLAEAKAKTETAECFSDESFKATGGFVVDEANLRIEFNASNVKWYDGYADVDCHNALVDMANEYCDAEIERVGQINNVLRTEFENKYGNMSYKEVEEQNIPRPNYEYEAIGFSYVRIGEEDDDNDSRWSGWEEAINRCRLTRSIEFDDS